jgi:hypothetical protein
MMVIVDKQSAEMSLFDEFSQDNGNVWVFFVLRFAIVMLFHLQ